MMKKHSAPFYKVTLSVEIGNRPIESLLDSNTCQAFATPDAPDNNEKALRVFLQSDHAR